jgi:hypothetical protein
MKRVPFEFSIIAASISRGLIGERGRVEQHNRIAQRRLIANGSTFVPGGKTESFPARRETISSQGPIRRAGQFSGWRTAASPQIT